MASQRYEDIEPIFDIIKNFGGKVVFEVSIKGGNKQEFSITSKRKEDDYFLVFNCIEHLKELRNKFPNVDFVSLAGFGPNIRFLKGNLIKNRIVLYNPIKNKPFFHPSNWDEHFTKLYRLITDKYPHFEHRMPMAGLEDRRNWGWEAIKRAKIVDPEHVYDSYSTVNEELEKQMNELKRYFFFTEPSDYYPFLFQ